MSEHEGFTPGPWYLEDVEDSANPSPEWGIEVWHGRGLALMCEVVGGDNLKERLANARLISDAPRLLAENARLREANTKLIDALECAQWCGSRTYLDGSDTPACPLCAQSKHEGHLERCPIGSALSAAGEEG